ncbi:hypothetical protein CPB83DRAFT_899314 [Crepidotus variabilis]|uniref:Uncharacterized protein n=1 Tax=Crepidotus variabilis TaxID=179855 RepID=A0A9P6E5D5_9AGAR|nr:hypothetical protein CPB83DRAFT_899314 [Crepidotus variabilis]
MTEPENLRRINLFKRRKKDKSIAGGRQVSATNRETLGSPSLPLIDEGTRLDVDKLVSNLREDSNYRNWYTRAHRKTDEEFFRWFDDDEGPRIKKQIGTEVRGAKPSSRDPSVRYTHLDVTETNSPLTIRWWYGNQFGYNFDLINPETQAPVEPPHDLEIEYWQHGNWLQLISLREAAQRCGGETVTGPPQWVVEPGASLRLRLNDLNLILGIVVVPHAPPGADKVFDSFSTLKEAISHRS